MSLLRRRRGGHFSPDQLQRHADALYEQGDGVRLLMCLGKLEGNYESGFDRIRAYCSEELDGDVTIGIASYEELASALDLSGLPKNLTRIVTEFRNYLDEEGLLPSWQTRLDLVNCARNIELVVEDRVYMCPARGGAYSHKRSKYFGAYKDKAAQYVAQIEAVVDLSDGDPPEFKWKNGEIEEDEALERARAARQRRRSEKEPATRVFLLGELYPTRFVKDSKYGMQGSKQYFDVASLDVEDVEELADELNGRTWSEFK